MNSSAMKKILLLAAALLSLSFFANAQSLDRALERLETVRSQKGEQSQEYLSALDSVIVNATMLGEISKSFVYRQQHYDIVKQMKGETSVEAADDLWRLGNVSRMLGDTISGLNYHIQSAAVFEKSDYLKDQNYVQHFGHCLLSIIQTSVSERDIKMVEQYTNKLKLYSANSDGLHSCGYLDCLCLCSYYNNLVGNKDDAFYYSKEIINDCVAIDSCNYSFVNAAYSFLSSYYHSNNQHELAIKTKKEYLNKLDTTKEDFFNEKVQLLWDLLVIDLTDLGEAIAYGKRAEQMLSDYYPTQDDLFKDKRYYGIISHIALIYNVTANFLDELPYRSLCCEMLKHNGEVHTKNYYDALFALFCCAVNGGEYPTAYQIAPELEQMIFKYSDEPYKDAIHYTSFLITTSLQMSKHEDALRYCDDYIDLLKTSLEGEDLMVGLAEALSIKAEIYIISGNRKEAEACIDEFKKMLDNITDSEHLLVSAISMYKMEGQLAMEYNKAMVSFDTALIMCNRLVEISNETISSFSSNTISLTNSSDGYAELEPIKALANLDKYQNLYATVLMNKGKTQVRYGKMTDAYNSYKDAVTIFEQTRSKNDTDYIGCLMNIAYCQMELANYSDAINTIDATMHLIKQLYGVENPYYAGCLQNYALYYHRIGAFDDALRYSEEAVKVNKKLFGENSFQYTQSLGSAGGMYLSLGMPEKADELLSEAFMLNKTNGVVLPSDIYCHLLTVYSNTLFELGRYEEGWEVYEQAKELTESVYGWDSRANAKFHYDFGMAMLRFRKGEEVSYESFLTTCGIMYGLGYTSDPLLLNAEFWYGVSALAFQKPIALDYIPLICKATKDYYYNNFVFFPSKERDLIWSSLSDITKVIFSTKLNDSCDLTLYDYLLFSKSLLVSTSNNFQQAVFSTKQEDIINQFNDIQALQRSIDNQDFGTSLDDQTTNVTSSVELYEIKTSMERKLIAEMKSLGYSVIDSVSYNDVASSLKPNEIAIEYVDYYHLLGKQTYYVALLAKCSWDKPVYVQLCTEDELKACLGNPNVTYSTDDLYRLLWQPLSEYIGDSYTVYFSPSGMLHTIALESIHTPDGSCLSDKYNLVRLTSTREMCKAKQPKTYETGAIYGGLQYDVEQQRMAEVAAMNKTELEESPAFALRGEDRGNWNYLPGTLAEAEHIAGIMRQANIGCGLYEGDLGSEESFKALSGGHTDIIHLATHGYFIEGEKADMNDFMNSLSPLARQKANSIIDPLLRSGLILSGGNNAWLGKEVPEGIEDGVLTALEISTMNLSGTDMVVMSACETGLGDITSDGVFGLQRAFKMAGVQTLVMSLWKVDDNAASLMMQTFYEQLFSGKAKREAFNLAQAAVRAKYPEPYYWAGFVMLD